MSMSSCAYVFMCLCLHVSMCPCPLVHVSMPPCPCLHVSMFPCLNVSMSMSPGFYVSIFSSMSPCPRPCQHVLVHVCMSSSMSACPRPCLYVLVHVSMSSSMLPCPRPCCHVMFPCPRPCFYVHVYVLVLETLLQTENGTDGKRQLPFVCCKRKTETANFCLFAANGNGKWKFVFYGQWTINGYRRLPFQQKCPFMHICRFSRGFFVYYIVHDNCNPLPQTNSWSQI